MRVYVFLIITMAILAGFAVYSFCRLSSSASQVSGRLEGVYQAVLAEKLDEAKELCERGHEEWRRNEGFLSCIVDHAVLHEIGISFIRLTQYLERDQAKEAEIEIKTMQYLLYLLPKAERLSWQNVF